MAKTISTDRARQGPRGRKVLMVLVGGLILAMIVWAGVEFYGEEIDQGANQPAVETQN